MIHYRVVISYPTFPSSNYELELPDGGYTLLRKLLAEIMLSEITLTGFPITIAITELK